ncbi:MAG TPA: hypothetical protein VM388_14395 [Acidimicrobiales bacterium]|nr:hypothetical protein [Acidimicrobiales bacterium]
MAVVAALLGACGDEPADEAPGQVTTTAAAAQALTTSTSAPGRSYAADFTSADGHRYRITLALGARPAAGAVLDCPTAPTAGRYSLPVTLIVANGASDRAAPFPPVRIEMAAPAGTKPAQVLVRDPAGTCTFSPRVASIGPGASVVFNGTSPLIEEGAPPGAAGRIEVKISETTFSLVAPLP